MTRNRWTFGLGTIGRDMVFSLISMFLIVYMTEVVRVPVNLLAWITAYIVAVRIFDALNDPIMGLIVDNTKTRYGKFKPWIAFGALTTGILMILMFSAVDASDTSISFLFGMEMSWNTFAVVFCILYFFWSIAYTTNDISYWSMLPALSVDQQEREKIGSIARICANIGLFFVVAGIVPITSAFGGHLGSPAAGYMAFTLLIVGIMWAGQLITLFGVKEPHITKTQPSTKLRDLVSIIVKNDQLLLTAICMTLFMIGYMTTTGFGLYFFIYVYGNEDMFSIFAIILGVSQIAALAVFPQFTKKFSRKKLYAFAVGLVTVGYIVFFFAPTDTMLFIGIAGTLLFIGQAFIQLMMLMFLADSVDYGHLKLGKRNDSINFSLQPLINKLSGAIGSGVVGFVVILSGIAEAETATDVSYEGLLLMRAAMLIFPLICIVISFLIYRGKFIIDEQKHAEILDELRKRGELS